MGVALDDLFFFVQAVPVDIRRQDVFNLFYGGNVTFSTLRTRIIRSFPHHFELPVLGFGTDPLRENP